MATISILNDKITSVPLIFENTTNQVVSPISGDTYSVVSSSPSLGVAIGGTAATPLLVMTPMVQVGTGYTVTVTDTKGLPPLVITVNVGPDPALATQMVLNTTLLTVVSQAIPTAPGP